MNLGLIFYFLMLCVVVLGILFYMQVRKFFTLLYYHTSWQNTINLEIIVREIITKATIISVNDLIGSKLEGDEKIEAIIEKASAISADVLLQHSIEPRNYDLPSLVKVELYRIRKG